MTYATYGSNILLTKKQPKKKILNTQHYLKEVSKIFWLSLIISNFLPLLRFFSSVYKFWCIKKHHLYYLYYILYTLSFCYLYIVSEIYVGKGFLKDGCYSQQIISAVAKESLIPHNLTQRAPEIQNL